MNQHQAYFSRTHRATLAACVLLAACVGGHPTTAEAKPTFLLSMVEAEVISTDQRADNEKPNPFNIAQIRSTVSANDNELHKNSVSSSTQRTYAILPELTKHVQ